MNMPRRSENMKENEWSVEERPLDPISRGEWQRARPAAHPSPRENAASDTFALPTPAVLHVVVDVADVPALEEEGGPEVVQEFLREAIERDGLPSVLRRLREPAEA